MDPIISIEGINKTYESGHQALTDINLDIRRGELFALLGPNGAGKTTLIGIICGLVNANSGKVSVDGHDVVSDYRASRSLIGLVPQELSLASFETVINAVRFSRGLYGKPPNDVLIEQLLKDLSLWEKRDTMIMALSGGMKRRLLIAKALCHEPNVLFLDEPTAGVDVELRHDMWQMIHRLRERGVTIILTTHYIEEAEEMADRIGIINKGKIVMVEEKSMMMERLGTKQLTFTLQQPLSELPPHLLEHPIELSEDGSLLIYTYDTQKADSGIRDLLRQLDDHNIDYKDLHSHQSSLEEIFVNLVREKP